MSAFQGAFTKYGAGKGVHTFTKEQATVLIGLYKRQPHLYVTSSKHYKNKTRRHIAFKFILQDFVEHFPYLDHLTVDDLRKKVNSLRTQFFAEQNKIKKSQVIGAGVDDLYVPSLWCYGQMMFLADSDSAPVRCGESPFSPIDPLRVEYNEELSHEDPINANEPGVILDEKSQELSTVNEMLYEGSFEDLNEGLALSSSGSSLDVSRSAQPPTKKRRVEVCSDDKSAALRLIQKASTFLENTAASQPISEIDAFVATLGVELKLIKSKKVCRRLRREITNLVHKELDKQDEHE